MPNEESVDRSCVHVVYPSFFYCNLKDPKRANTESKQMFQGTASCNYKKTWQKERQGNTSFDFLLKLLTPIPCYESALLKLFVPFDFIKLV
jgi:hypothetical protein